MCRVIFVGLLTEAVPIAMAGEYAGTMLARQRVQLRFGPYRSPKFKYGATVVDRIRGEVTIVGLRDAKIPWPIGKRGRSRGLILYGDLAKAVGCEASVT
jgi:hypothetical protein